MTSSVSKSLLSPGIFVSDEIYRSGDPAAHAVAIASNAKNYGFGWVALQFTEENKPWAAVLRQALVERGLLFIGWSQGMLWERERDEYLTKWNLNGHIPNVETPAENNEYVSKGAISWLRSNFLHLGVIFTEGAWGKNPDGSYNKQAASPWASFVGMPEAFMPVSTGWTPPVMSYVAMQYGFSKIAPTLGLWGNGWTANHYTQYMAGIPSWSIWRYVGLSGADLEETKKWPHYDEPDVPEPVGISVEEGHKRNIETRNKVNERLLSQNKPVLGPNAVLEIANDMSQAVLDKKTVPVVAIRDALRNAGIE